MSTDKQTLLDGMKNPQVNALAMLLVSSTFKRIGQRLTDKVIPDDLHEDTAKAMRAMGTTMAIDLATGEDEKFRMGLYATFMLGYVTGRDGWVFNDGENDSEVELFNYAREQLEKARARVEKN